MRAPFATYFYDSSNELKTVIVERNGTCHDLPFPVNSIWTPTEWCKSVILYQQNGCQGISTKISPGDGREHLYRAASSSIRVGNESTTESLAASTIYAWSWEARCKLRYRLSSKT
jgi:hypothetical protein